MANSGYFVIITATVAMVTIIPGAGDQILDLQKFRTQNVAIMCDLSLVPNNIPKSSINYITLVQMAERDLVLANLDMENSHLDNENLDTCPGQMYASHEASDMVRQSKLYMTILDIPARSKLAYLCTVTFLHSTNNVTTEPIPFIPTHVGSMKHTKRSPGIALTVSEGVYLECMQNKSSLDGLWIEHTSYSNGSSGVGQLCPSRHTLEQVRCGSRSFTTDANLAVLWVHIEHLTCLNAGQYQCHGSRQQPATTTLSLPACPASHTTSSAMITWTQPVSQAVKIITVANCILTILLKYQ